VKRTMELPDKVHQGILDLAARLRMENGGAVKYNPSSVTRVVLALGLATLSTEDVKKAIDKEGVRCGKRPFRRIQTEEEKSYIVARITRLNLKRMTAAEVDEALRAWDAQRGRK